MIFLFVFSIKKMQSQHKMFLSKILNKHANPTLLNCSMCLLLTSCPQTSQQAFSVLIILLSLNVSVHAYLCVCDLGFVYTSSGGCLSVYWQMLNVSLGLRGHPPPSTLNICTLPFLALHLGPKSGQVFQIHCYSSMLTRTFTPATGIMPLEKKRHSSCGPRQPYIVLQTKVPLNRS